MRSASVVRSGWMLLGYVTFATTGCVVEESATTLGEPRPSSKIAVQTASFGPDLSTVSTQAVPFVDAEGRAWSVRKLTAFAPTDKAASRLGTHSFRAPSTFDELADARRMRRMVTDPDGNAWEYLETNPPYARVAAAMERDRLSVQGHVEVDPASGNPRYVEHLSMVGDEAVAMDGFTRLAERRFVDGTSISFVPSTLTQSRSPSASNRAFDPSVPFGELAQTASLLGRADESEPVWSPLSLTGGDDRVWMTHAEAAGAKFEIALSAYPLGTPGRCSGTMIGNRTAISAAHCFWPRFASTWDPPRAWAMGYVHTNSTVGGEQITRSYPPGDNGYACFGVTIPARWGFEAVPGSGVRAYFSEDDWAVIDFTGCTAYGGWPGPTTGFASPFVNSSSTLAARLTAYDTGGSLPDDDNTKPGSQRLGITYLPQSLLNRSTPNGTTNAAPGEPYLIQTQIDLTEGASGGGLRQRITTLSGTYRFVGPIVAADAVGSNQGLNYARKLDNDMWSFTQASCDEY